VGDPASAPTEVRGYTGHEHLDDVGLIHMNGRVYDPLVGRMLSPDPLVPSPGDAQSWNAYSYARNDPLGRIDPSGFDDEVVQWDPIEVPAFDRHWDLFDRERKIVPLDWGVRGPDIGVRYHVVDPQPDVVKLTASGYHPRTPPLPEFLPVPLPAAPATLSPEVPCGQGGNDCYAPAATPAPTPNPVNPVHESGGSPTTVAETLRDFANYTINERGGIGGELFDILGGGGILEGTADVLEGNLGGAAWNVATTIFKPAKIVEKTSKIVPKGGTYKLKDVITGKVRRTGRSKDLNVRRQQHARDPTTKDLEFEVDRRTDDYAAQRGREQILYDLHPEADLNKIRGISLSNPDFDDYMDAGRALD
jgi:RHS repeat-associated protein